MKRTMLVMAMAVALALSTVAMAFASGHYSVTDGAVDNGDGTYTIDTTGSTTWDPANPNYGSIVRDGDGTTVAGYDSFLTFDYERTAPCGGGSPRAVLYLDGGNYLANVGNASVAAVNVVAECSGDGEVYTGSWNATAATGAQWVEFGPGGQIGGQMTWVDVLAGYGDVEVTSSALIDDSFWSATFQSVSVYSNVVLGPPAMTKDDCKNDGWIELGYKNQGQCVSDFARNK